MNYVAPKARFSGVSKTMLEHLEEGIRERGIRDGRLTDETSLGFACAAVEVLLREIRLWRAADQ